MHVVRPTKSCLLHVLLAVLFLAAIAQGDVCYWVTDTSPCRGYGINNNAQVVGYGHDGAGLWQNGSVTELGMLPGYAKTGAEGISESGRYVAGYAYNDVEGNIGRGVLWTEGVMTELPPLPGDAGSVALKVNDAGIAVGYSSISGDYYEYDMRPVYWQNGVPHLLPTLGGFAGDALDITNSGLIIGDTQRADGSWTTTLWVNGVPVDVGGLPGYEGSWSRAINEAGQAAVNSDSQVAGGTAFKAALWDNGVFTEAEGLPGRPNTYAYGVNSSKQIVGRSFVEYTGTPGTPGYFIDPVAMLWDDGVTYDLNSLIPADSGLLLTIALGINDRGQITGRSYHDGVSTPCLLTPVPILTPELSGGATADVVYDRYGNVGGYAAGLPAGSQLVGGTTALDNFQLTGGFGTLILHYDEADLLYDNTIEWTLRLYWYNDLLSQWVLAGNTSNLTWNPDAQFVMGAPTDVLGDWGLNMIDNYVWANVDHASTYAMGGHSPVPEPASLMSLCAGLALLGGYRIRRRK